MSTEAAEEGADSRSLPYRYQWPRPSVTVDCLIYALDEGTPWILLIKRKNDPFKGGWALPGERNRTTPNDAMPCHFMSCQVPSDPDKEDEPKSHMCTTTFHKPLLPTPRN